MSMRPKLVVGNWKMNGSRALTIELLTQLNTGTRAIATDVAVCVPSPYLELAVSLVQASSIAIGAQTTSEHDKGAFTGDVSAAMLHDVGCRVVIVGHSERRSLRHETDEQVAGQAGAAHRHGLTPIICVGETLEERDAGETESVVLRQLDHVVPLLAAATPGTCVLAYEPVWAIGTGRTATAEQAQEVHGAIRRRIAETSQQAALATRILYGGSVKPSTATGLFAMPDVDGALVGGASLIADDFIAIAAAAQQLPQ